MAAATIWIAGQRPMAWLELRSLRSVDVRSYGLYLWHFAIAGIAWTGNGPCRLPLAAGVAASFAACALSWLYVEHLIRSRGVRLLLRGS
jgi:peptidoglycan/LPS O-acetylase OafA/YrhL